MFLLLELIHYPLGMSLSIQFQMNGSTTLNLVLKNLTLFSLTTTLGSMDWKRSLPADLFYVSQNGLVIPRYISKPIFSFILLTTILVVIVIVAVTTPYLGGRRINLPEIAHPQFQFIDDRTSDNFLVTIYLGEDLLIWNSDVPIVDPDSPALAPELSCQFQAKKEWIEQLQLPFLQKKHFENMGYFRNKRKLFLHADAKATWGKVVSLLKAAQAAGVRDVCFLTEQRSESCD
jgi:biopolymer transport protein ExbD